jgi:hypothetical protein
MVRDDEQSYVFTINLEILARFEITRRKRDKSKLCVAAIRIPMPNKKVMRDSIIVRSRGATTFAVKE